MTSQVTVYLGLGANLGNRERNITRAAELLQEHIAGLRLSTLYDTAPEGLTNQPRFLNAVCCGTTKLSPEALLAFAQEIERHMGRVPGGPLMGPRSLDIDILYYGDRVINTPPLVIPHPRMAARAFVVVPLAELDPGVKHPVLKKTARELAEAVQGQADIKPFDREKAYWAGLKRGKQPIPLRNR
jgi:2-amino-4-hydroxy-6-hydroxymethyldihydropteridine diphosphokinase